MAGRRRSSPTTSRAAVELAKAYDRVRTAAAGLDKAEQGLGDRLRLDVAAAIQGALTRSAGAR